MPAINLYLTKTKRKKGYICSAPTYSRTKKRLYQPATITIRALLSLSLSLVSLIITIPLKTASTNVQLPRPLNAPHNPTSQTVSPRLPFLLLSSLHSNLPPIPNHPLNLLGRIAQFPRTRAAPITILAIRQIHDQNLLFPLRCLASEEGGPDIEALGHKLRGRRDGGHAREIRRRGQRLQVRGVELRAGGEVGGFEVGRVVGDQDGGDEE